MTQDLARAAGRVIAIEVDPRLVESLRRLAREQPNIEVAAGDVLALDLPALAGGRFQVYGNLPYYITSPILRRLFDSADRIGAIHAVLQWEVAARLVARPSRREYGYLSLLAQFYSRPEIVLRIPPAAFRPRPRVASALVALRSNGGRAALELEDEKRFLKFVQQCFAQKRKILANNLSPLVSPERLEGLLAEVGLSHRARAEELTLVQFAALFRKLPRG
jgi:16S rRNA (adenine1518-N6/adenine1519-N6)-dimethyltransferase